MANISPKRNGEFLKEVFRLLDENPDGLQARSLLAQIAENMNLTEFEKGTYPSDSSKRPRFEKIVRFATIATVKAGWLVKVKGTWTLTQEGRVAYKSITDPEALYRQAFKLYRGWKKSHDEELEGGDEELGEVTPATSVITLEEAQENSWEQIQEYLSRMDPYEFQNLVGDLLSAMGYYVDWIAPPGRDKGIDIVAFTDPLGAGRPRIVVQVKHRNSQKTTAKDLREFLSVIGSEHMGIFVSSAGFTTDAEEEARTQERRIVTLLTLDKLFELWTQHYEKLSQEAKRRLPLRSIYYLDLD